MGFRVVEELARRHSLKFERRRANSLIAEGLIDGQKVVLAKPQTFMNLSGRAVSNLCRLFGCSIKDILVVYDDLDLPVGKIRLRERGSTAGHKGLQSISGLLKTTAFNRLKVGIGRPGDLQDAVHFVLSRFNHDEEKLLSEVVPRAAVAAETWLTEGPKSAMNKFN